MRFKKEIDALNDQVDGVAFPLDNIPFHNYRARLRDLISENFGYSAGKALEYNADNGTFFWEESEGCGWLGTRGADGANDRARVSIKRDFVVNPKVKNLLGEFERVESEREAFKKQVRAVLHAVLSLGGEV